jgi:hypothetical protein
VILVFHPEAEQEFLDTIDYYETQQPGLGEDFSPRSLQQRPASRTARMLGLYWKTRSIAASHTASPTASFTASMNRSSIFLQSCTFGENPATGNIVLKRDDRHHAARHRAEQSETHRLALPRRRYNEAHELALDRLG